MARGAVRTKSVIPEHIYKGSIRDAPQPGEEAKGVEPGTDGVCPLWYGSSMFEADFEEVGTQLNPVVDEERQRDERPHWREEGEIAKLEAHLAEVGGDVIFAQFGLVA